jgi:hypothetical protein
LGVCEGVWVANASNKLSESKRFNSSNSRCEWKSG